MKLYEQKIKFFDYPSLYLRYEKEFDNIFKDVCSRGAYILKVTLKNLKKSLSDFLNVKHVFGVADGTNALILGLKVRVKQMMK